MKKLIMIIAGRALIREICRTTIKELIESLRKRINAYTIIRDDDKVLLFAILTQIEKELLEEIEKPKEK